MSANDCEYRMFRDEREFKDWRNLILHDGEKELLAILLDIYDNRKPFVNMFETHNGGVSSPQNFRGISISKKIDYEGMKSLNMVFESRKGKARPIVSVFMHPLEYTELYSKLVSVGPLAPDGVRVRFANEITLLDEEKDKTRISYDFACVLKHLFEKLQAEFVSVFAKRHELCAEKFRKETAAREKSRIQLVEAVAKHQMRVAD